MNHYLNEFLSLQCAPDVLATVGYMGKKADKEITEAMAIIKRLRTITLREPNRYDLIDICSGNALVPVIAAHLLPIKNAIAMDKLPRQRNWHLAKRFFYQETDVYTALWTALDTPTILTAVHGCRDLAEEAVRIYNRIDAIRHLILMPCCVGNLPGAVLQFIKDAAGESVAWTTKLALQCEGRIRIGRDTGVLSPKNYVITASKEDGP